MPTTDLALARRSPMRKCSSAWKSRARAASTAEEKAAVADHKICPQLDAPATPECVLMAIERVKAQKKE